MNKPIIFITTGLLALLSLAATVPQDRLTVNDKKINKIIAKMTLQEKIEMLHSKTNMSSEGVPRLGIQDIKYTDGPFGIREENGEGFRPMGWTTDSATYFPTGSALAATWSEELAYRYGTGMGTEARLRGKDIILGPAINIQRLPVGGRTYEYLSEDPVLAAVLATSYTKGAQAAGTAVCLKHFAVNNQETDRGSVDVTVDDRALREIYLKPFEKAIVDGGAYCVMPAYNKVGGFYCSENNRLLNEILRGEWGFKGMTVSDWGGTHSTVGAAFGGLDVQMPGDNYFGQALLDSVQAGIVPEEIINDKVRHILRLRYAVEAIPENVANTQKVSKPEHQQTAYEVATKSIVLLKNDGNLLPISKDVRKIAIIGYNAIAKTASGGIGAGVKTPYEITPLEGIVNRASSAITTTFAEGYKNYAGAFARWGMKPGEKPDPKLALDVNEHLDPTMLAQALKLAKEADLVLYVCGTNKWIETEGMDRQNIKLPVGQEELVVALAAVNPNIVSIIISGGPCDLQVLKNYSQAIVQGWWNGMEGGKALAAVLFGDIAPSGKLPFTFPVALEDSPAFALGSFPPKSDAQADLFTSRYRRDLTKGKQQEAEEPANPTTNYTEGSLVGYRWFDTKNVPVMYAFGHGLSYVDFAYDALRTDKTTYKANEVIKVSFDLTNKGGMDADEVAQLYVHHIDAQVAWPSKELKAFRRVTLTKGSTQHVTLEIPVAELRYWDEASNAWQLDPGRLELLLGSASDDIRLKTTITVSK